MYVWGTGKYLDEIFDYLNKKYEINGFIDNNPKSDEKYGKKVVKPSDVNFEDVEKVFVASSYMTEIFRELREKYFVEREKIFSEVLSEENYIKYEINENDEIIGVFEENKFLIDCDESKVLLESIFLFKEYAFTINKESIFFDLGFNRGFTSIYIGRNSVVKKIYAYEPFKETIKLGIKNLEMNQNILDKVKFNMMGIGDKNEKISLKYNPNNKWGMSTVKDIYCLEDFELVEIEIKDVYEELCSKIDRRYQNILKIDIEGAEYGVMKRLSETKLIDDFEIIILEWHFEGSKWLIKLLEEHNFITIQKHISDGIGLIYAIKSENRVNLE